MVPEWILHNLPLKIMYGQRRHPRGSAPAPFCYRNHGTPTHRQVGPSPALAPSAPSASPPLHLCWSSCWPSCRCRPPWETPARRRADCHIIVVHLEQLRVRSRRRDPERPESRRLLPVLRATGEGSPNSSAPPPLTEENRIKANQIEGVGEGRSSSHLPHLEKLHQAGQMDEAATPTPLHPPGLGAGTGGGRGARRSLLVRRGPLLLRSRGRCSTDVGRMRMDWHPWEATTSDPAWIKRECTMSVLGPSLAQRHPPHSRD
jgi:hypothetical protein